MYQHPLDNKLLIRTDQLEAILASESSPHDWECIAIGEKGGYHWKCLGCGRSLPYPSAQNEFIGNCSNILRAAATAPSTCKHCGEEIFHIEYGQADRWVGPKGYILCSGTRQLHETATAPSAPVCNVCGNAEDSLNHARTGVDVSGEHEFVPEAAPSAPTATDWMRQAANEIISNQPMDGYRFSDQDQLVAIIAKYAGEHAGADKEKLTHD